ncbi:MAG: 50S ribosomal protein L25/general stress protein Ctc [Mycobacteriaceae bacterium]
MSDANRLDATVRTEFGKGAARRARRDGQVPAVLYGHGTDPQHLNLPARDFAAILRGHGTNAILNLNIAGEDHLALTKSVVVHPIRRYIEHADLLVINRGEKVSVEVAIIITGDAEAGSLIAQDTNTIEVEAPVMSIPEQIEVSVEGLAIGTQINAADVVLPEGVTLVTDPEVLVVNISAAPTAADMESDGSGNDSATPAAEAAE